MNAEKVCSDVTRKLRAVIEHPPRLPSHAGDVLSAFAGVFFEFNYALDTCTPDTRIIAVTATIEAMQALVRAMCHNYEDFSKYKNRNAAGPWSTIMALFVVVANFAVIVEDRQPTPRLWQCSRTALDLAYIAENELCVTPTRPVKSYTVKDMTVALHLLGLRWYALTFHPALSTYIYGLFHRALILAAHPGPDTVFNDPVYVQPVPDNAGLCQLSTAGLRLFSMQLIRMLFLTTLEPITTPAPRNITHPMLTPVAAAAGVRRFMVAQVAVLARTRDAKKELAARFPHLMLIHGDPEEFTRLRGMEKGRAQTVLMALRSHTQQAYAKLQQFLLLDKLIQLTSDDEPDHFDKWTRGQHAYMLLLKTYIMNMALTPLGIDFFKDYVVFELDLPHFINHFAHANEPLVIQLFGKLHVHYRKRIHICASVEHALALWCHIVLTHLGGILNNKHIAPALHAILGDKDRSHADATVPICYQDKPVDPETPVYPGKIVID